MPKKIKIKSPKNLDAALQHFQSGNLQKAEELCRLTLQQNPNHSRTLYLLGKIFYYSEKYDHAIQYITKAIKINPKDSYYHLDLGLALLNKGMTGEAIDSFHHAQELKQHSPEVCLNLGVAFSNKGMAEKAIEHFKKAIEFNPEFAEAFNNLGVVLEGRDMLNDAMASYEKALKINPDYAEAHNNLANVRRKQGDFDKATEHYRKALTIKPDYAEAYNNLGNLLKDKCMIDEAIEHYKNAINLKPDYAEAYFNLGILYKNNNMLTEAIECYEKAVSLKSDYVNAYFNLGIMYESLNLLDKAVELYNKALSYKSDYADAHLNISLIMLKCGDFINGWKKHEWRKLKDDSHARPFPQSDWDGLPIRDKTLFISAEQGIGDEIMFASCIPELIAPNNSYILECNARLVPLLGRSFPEVEVIPYITTDHFDISQLPPADLKVAIASLPMFLRPDLSSFPQHTSFLVADNKKVEIWQERFKVLGNEFKVGISWRGGSHDRVKNLRSIPLDLWSSILSIPGVQFINLQYGDCAEELLSLKNKSGISVHDWEDSDPLKDLDGFAAQITALDLVISVDNSTVHMAGALGTPVWTLLPSACDWRWMVNFEDTPWYKTIRLFRQKEPGDWEDVIQRIASNLGQFVNTGVISEINNSYKEHNIK